MKFFVIFLSLIFFQQNLSAQNQNNYWQQQVNYNIAVALNDKNHSLDAIAKISYINNSPDTLKFIWFHLWPNAYKNDKTAFSEQLLINGRTDFYFSDDSNRGYINKLDFKVDDVNAITEPHPQHIDITKLILPKPLAPKQTIQIETPFHLKLPYNFSRGGHIINDYQITQWYPKPAVYDSKGWHEMPYLDQGEFYSEFGIFDVSISVPENYLVAATGELQTTTELEFLKKIGKTKFAQQPNYKIEDIVVEKKSFFPSKPVKKTKNVELVKSKIKIIGTKTLHYHQDNVHDFAWFASKNFLVQYDTLNLQDKIVDVFSFSHKNREKTSVQNIKNIKSTLNNYSNWLGVYPYKIATVVLGKQDKDDGMEYPTITYINTQNDATSPKDVISHEVGHNWFYGILASNERDHAWMDEGMNTYYDFKTQSEKSIISEDDILTISSTLKSLKKYLPIDTISIAYPKDDYALMEYMAASNWMQQLENQLGKQIFDSAMKIYYETWKFKHPYPQDFKAVVERVSGKSIDEHFSKLYSSSTIYEKKKAIKIVFGFPIKNMSKYNFISYAPTITYNMYDGIRLGAAIHNYQLPLPKFQFIINPSFGTRSNLFNGFGRVSYNVYKRKSWLEFAVSYQQYTYDSFISDVGEKFNLGIARLVPSIKYTLYKNDLRSTERTVFGFKTFYLNQENLLFSNNNKISTTSTKSYINRLYISKFDNRVLYPYHINLTIDQGEEFVRAGFTAKHFFNYAKSKGGIEARFFAGKFFYLNNKTFLQQYNTDKYHLNLSGPKGYEDYTFSDYFIGRSEFEGFQNQQIMERDGFFKARTDYLGNKIGKSDDWLIATNFNIDVPGFPALKLFADIGTYAEAWVDNPATGRFLFDAGVQLSLFNNAVNIYAPILFSKVYRDYNKSILVDKIFTKTISFTINLQNLHFNKLSRDIPL